MNNHIDAFSLYDPDDDLFTLKLYYEGQWWIERVYRHFKGGKWRYVDYCDKDRISVLDISEMLEELKLFEVSILYCYLEPTGDFKTGLRLVTCDNDILSMCSWVPRLKVIEFYAERRKEKKLLKFLKVFQNLKNLNQGKVQL